MRSEEQVRAEIAAQSARINAAYWSFTRCAKAPPPMVAVPGAYRRRSELEQELATIRSSAPKVEEIA